MSARTYALMFAGRDRKNARVQRPHYVRLSSGECDRNAILAVRLQRRQEKRQHPLQMLFIFLSTLESSEVSVRMMLSPCIAGP
jgi:hypothetical protein